MVAAEATGREGRNGTPNDLIGCNSGPVLLCEA